MARRAKPDRVAGMTMTYRVEAYNLSHASENRIHDDATAQRFGFTGGLVPGVEVFAYCCHPPLEKWGRDFLSRGEVSAGFQKPVYDGRIATVTATPEADGLTLSVEKKAKYALMQILLLQTIDMLTEINVMISSVQYWLI